MQKYTRLTIVAFSVAILCGSTRSMQGCALKRVSVPYTGQEANGYSELPSLSNDGRFVAFSSLASNLVPGDTNWSGDIFVLDRRAGTVERVSVDSAGMEANGHSGYNAISADGRMAVFGSLATNLDPRDTDQVSDVYVHDRVTKTTTLVSERLGTGPSVQGCYGVSISADGRYVAFDCLDDNVLPGDTNLRGDVFVQDTVTQVTELVSLGPTGQQGDQDSFFPAISADGRFVAFISAATNWYPAGGPLVDGVYVRDRQTGTTIAATLRPDGTLSSSIYWTLAISADGRYVAYEGGGPDLVPGQPYTHFGNDVLRWDRLTGKTLNVCTPPQGGPASYPSRAPKLSADGRFIAFETRARNLTVQPGWPLPMVIWKDLETGTTVVTNETPSGDPSNNWVNDPAISGDGRVVAFVSKATNLVPGASGSVYHVYVRACDVASPSTYCKPAKPPGGCVASMTFQGSPSATAGSGFDVRVDHIDAQQMGLVFYGTSGPWGTRPGPEGYLCVHPPVRRLPAQATGGTAGCDGGLSMDFNTWIASGADPMLVAGQAVHAQGWFRSGAGASQFSDALAFLIGP